MFKLIMFPHIIVFVYVVHSFGLLWRKPYNPIISIHVLTQFCQSLFVYDSIS